MSITDPPGEVVVVTGGAGFLGQHIVKQLMEQDEFPVSEIRVFDIVPLTWHFGLEVKEKVGIDISEHRGDLCNISHVQSALHGASIVIHNASVVDVTSLPDKDRIYRVNVQGTKNIIRACKNNNINILVYTSSASVVSKLGYYGKCKQEAERLILEANEHKLSNETQMRTCALRLPGMYGEGGTLLKVNIVGNIFIRSGNKTTRFQTAYVGNMAWSFVCAIRQLRRDPVNTKQNPAGRAICVVDDTPVTPYCEALDPFLKLLRIKASFMIPLLVLYILAFICEWCCFLLQPIYKLKLPLSKVAVTHMYCLPVFDSSESKMYLKFRPIYDYKECVQRSMVYFENELKLKDINCNINPKPLGHCNGNGVSGASMNSHKTPKQG